MGHGKICIPILGSCVQLTKLGGKILSQSHDMTQTSHIQHPTYHHNSQELSPYTMLNLTIMKPRGAVYIHVCY